MLPYKKFHQLIFSQSHCETPSYQQLECNRLQTSVQMYVYVIENKYSVVYIKVRQCIRAIHGMSIEIRISKDYNDDYRLISNNYTIMKSHRFSIDCETEIKSLHAGTI